MKRVLWTMVALALAGSLLWVVAQVVAPTQPLAGLFPSSPVLYLEMKDLRALMRDWNASKEKPLWLASENYEVFSRSNLFLKLQNAQKEFAAAAGVPPDMALLDNVAGQEAAIAIYDIGQLEFLYITHMPSARVTESSLWKTRGTYQPRQSSGLDYFVRVDKTSKRVAAFASAKDYLLLATREDVLASALSILAGQKGQLMTGEAWYRQSAEANPSPGDLRLVLNMPRLMHSPYMRSYWIQRNASYLTQYGAAISDATRGASEIREDRTLFRVVEEQPSWNENGVAQITGLAPLTAGFYQAWASPTAEQALGLMRDKILEPHPGMGPASTLAPGAASPDETVGTEGELETRIDEPPFEGSSLTTSNAALDLLNAGKLEAMMYVGASRVLPDGVFVGIDSAVVLLRGSNWDAATTRSALIAAGAKLDGPSPMAVSTSGPILVVANRGAFAQTILAGMARPSTQVVGRYAAVYRHSRELPNFTKLTKLLDNPLQSGGPAFLSGNVASLGDSLLGRLDSASIVVHDTGPVVTQKLTYKLKP